MVFKDYLEQHFEVRPVGAQLRIFGECPFCGSHDDKMYYNPANDKGVCFKCIERKGFGSISFVMAHAGVDYARALAILETGNDDAYMKEEEPVPVDALWFPAVVPLQGRPLDYARGRGIGNDLITKHGVCFCPNNTVLADGSIRYTRNRIIIPIRNMANELVGWVGRTIEKGREPKYLFPSGFKTSDNLFNIENIERFPTYVLLVEGTMDVFGWVNAGFKNAAGSFGKKISGAQIDVLRFIDPRMLFIAWDKDATAEKYRFMEEHMHEFQNIMFIDLGSFDADELPRGKLIEAVKGARPYAWDDKILSLLK